MKLFVLLCLFTSHSVFSQTNAELQQQLLDLQKRMNAMEKGKTKSNGLKVKDFGGKETNAPANRVGNSGSQIPESKMREVMESLKKGDAYMKERDQLLKEMEDEGL